MWKPDQGGFVGHGDGQMGNFVRDPIVQQPLHFHMEEEKEGAEESEVQTWNIDITVPYDCRIQGSHVKCKYITSIVRAELRAGSSSGCKKKH